MTGQPSDESYAVFVGMTPEAAEQLASAWAGAGRQVYRLDLRGVGDTSEVCRRYAATFSFPIPSEGLDAVVSLLADLDWLEPQEGHLLLVDGLDEADPQAVFDAVVVLPNIIDRWRSQGTPFVAALVGSTAADMALSALADENHQLLMHGKLPWAAQDTGPVTVVDCRRSPSTTV